MRRRVTFFVVALTGGVVVAASLGGNATGSSDPVALPGTITVAAERDEVIAKQQSQTKPPTYDPPPREPIPGQLSVSACDIDSRVPLTKGTNAWRAGGSRGDFYLAALVCAGAYRKNPNTGYFLIVRYPGSDIRFSQSLVDGAGPVTITDAPLGEEGSAHVWDAHIEFESEYGTAGYLDLADDSIHITQGPTSCPPDATGSPPDCGQAKFGVLRVVPKLKRVPTGQTVTFDTSIENVGEANAWQTQVCVKGPRRLVVIQDRCRWKYKLVPGEEQVGTFEIKVKKRPRSGRTIPLWFKATSYDGDKRFRKVILKVR